MNNYHIPADIENSARKRDTRCVYCGKEFSGDATIEHIDNDINNISLENIAICCNACNASKGNKKLSEWLESSYCKEHKITKESVAPVIKEFIQRNS